VKQPPGGEGAPTGYDEATFVESFVILNAAGGECLDDFERLRADPGLGETDRARSAFSGSSAEGSCMRSMKKKRFSKPSSGDYRIKLRTFPQRVKRLEGLGKVNQDLIQRFGERCAEQKIATVDQDTTIIESRKQEALHSYEGPRGYQPMLAVWRRWTRCWPMSFGMGMYRHRWLR